MYYIKSHQNFILIQTINIFLVKKLQITDKLT